MLLQVNVSGEETKSGIAAVEASRLLELALTCENVQCRGFMTMAPFGAEPAALRHVFGALRLLRDRLGRDVGCDLPELSMGMSQDFEAAIEEGATLVRVGTAVFGARN